MSVLVPYAWDEPTALPHITLKVQSGTCATYDMNTVGDGEKLYYENFIYIAFTHTFKRYSYRIIFLCFKINCYWYERTMHIYFYFDTLNTI